MINKIMKNSFVFALILLSVGFANAQKLSLADAIAKSMENNFDILIERQNVNTAKVNNTWGNAGLFPSITANLQGSTSVSDNQKTLNPFSIQAKTGSNQIQPTIRLNWNLLSIYNIVISKERLELLQAESDQNASVVITNTLQSVIMGYYVALLEKERLKQYQEQLNLSKDKYKYISVKRELGVSMSSETLLEENNFLTDSVNYINQELVYQRALNNLVYLMGGNTTTIPNYELTDKFKVEPMIVDIESLLLQLEQENVNLKKLYLTQKVLGTNSRLANWQRVPTLNIGANYSFSRELQDVSDWPKKSRSVRDKIDTTKFNVISSGINQRASYGLNFTISFNLFDGHRVKRAIQQAKIQEDIGNLRVSQMKASLSRDLQNAVSQYRTRQKIYQIRSRQREATAKNLAIAKDKFSNGSINSLDYRAIQNNHLTASISMYKAMYDLNDSKVTILRLTGGLVKDFNQ